MIAALIGFGLLVQAVPPAVREGFHRRLILKRILPHLKPIGAVLERAPLLVLIRQHRKDGTSINRLPGSPDRLSYRVMHVVRDGRQRGRIELDADAEPFGMEDLL